MRNPSTEEQQEKAAAAEIASAKTREQEALAELEKALAEARLRLWILLRRPIGLLFLRRF